MKKIICLLFTIFLALNAHAEKDLRKLEDEVIDRKGKLSDIDKKIKKEKKKIKKVEKEESTTTNQLNAIDKKLSKNRNELYSLNRRLKNLKKDVATANTQLDQINKDIIQRKELFSKRLIALYKYKRSGGILRVIFSSHSYPELSQRTKFIKMILSSDIQIIDHFFKQLSLVKEKRETLQENQKSLEKVKNSILKKKSQIDDQKKKKTVLLKKIRNEKKTYQAAVEELEKASRELQSLIDRLQREIAGKKKHFIPEDAKRFEALKGKLLFPLSGKIISSYGNRTDPQLNTVIFQKGIEISAKQGQEVRAIYEGTVLYADWFKGYGNIIIIDHGGSYYSLSAHVSKLFKSVGERVEAGEVIALAGDTGSLKGNCLYFELRHHGKPLNP
ncbi:MAG: peptidoglycan DD-metalloendopeptidase family protein, partial [Deltaproteobacteria bacterium]|nr:peptidoglycan DD-metalloendopeptidase family protein [Deltaproteobacteria bacterium]